MKYASLSKSPLSYFEEMLWQYHQDDEPCLFLPSLLDLSGNLSASILDIQSALASLRKKGYDYYAVGINSPITLCFASRVGLLHAG